ncbi:MAG TPA: hypothetical protein VGN37_13235 [Actinocatenispora sp.]
MQQTDIPTAPAEAEPEFVWEQDDLGVVTGPLARLVHAIEHSHYGDEMGPAHVITFAGDAWRDVTVHIEHVETDTEDWMYYALTCTWNGGEATATYVIDGLS